MSDAPLALVTGGCRRVGAAIASQLARHGWALALHGHSDAEPEPDLADALEVTGADWHGFVADLADADQCAGLIALVADRFGRAPDLLVNNASLFEHDEWHDLTAASLRDHFAVNAFAPVLLARELVARTDEGSCPAIICIADQRIRNPNGDQLAYTLSKQALAESVRTLARAFGDRARVNGVAPGLTIPTEDYGSEQLARLRATMPLSRLSAPRDIADAVLYLANARAVTGQMLFVDGGAHMLAFERDFVFLARDD